MDVDDKMILLVEDNADDEALMLRAFKKSHVENEEALDFLFCTGSYADRNSLEMPQVILLDLKLPKVDGLEVLRRLRADERMGLLPVVVLTSSIEERDVIESYHLGANSYVRKPVDFTHFMDAAQHLGLYWLVLNKLPPISLGAI